MAEVSYSYPKAAVGKRILAYLVDLFITVFPIGFILSISFGIYSSVYVDGNIFTEPDILMIILMIPAILIGFVWPIFYSLARDGFGAGQSWGKKICGLMVVNLNTNKPCNKIQSLVRNVFALLISGALSWVPVVNGISSLVEPIVALVHEKGQRIGDMVGNTQVIDFELYDPYRVT